MNNRQRFIAGCINPYYENFASKEEVRLAKQLARGRYWNDPEYSQYCAYSTTGKRMFFEYDDSIKLQSRKAARLWSKGKYKEAQVVYNTDVKYE